MKLYYTYVLLLNNRKFYTGLTNDIKKRYIDHKYGRVKSIKHFRPLQLVYFECCLSKNDASKREKQLKTGFGRGYIKNRIKTYLGRRRGNSVVE